MSSNVNRPPARSIERYERLLLLALAGPLCASLALWLAGWLSEAPVAIPLAGAAVLVSGAAWWANDVRPRRLARIGLAAAELAAIVLVAGWVVSQRATGFFTAEVLRGALLPLLVLHVAGMTLGASAASRRAARRLAHALPIAATATASGHSGIDFTGGGTRTTATSGSDGNPVRWRGSANGARPSHGLHTATRATAPVAGTHAHVRARWVVLGTAIKRRVVAARHSADLTAEHMGNVLVKSALTLMLVFWIATVVDLLYLAAVALMLVGAALTFALLLRVVDRAAIPSDVPPISPPSLEAP